MDSSAVYRAVERTAVDDDEGSNALHAQLIVDTAVHEVKDETGFDVALIGVYTNSHHLRGGRRPMSLPAATSARSQT